MHKLLQRQILRILGSDALPNNEAAWRGFLEKIDQAYAQSDDDRKLLERSLDLASGEMMQSNAALRTELSGRRASEERALRTSSILSATLDATSDGILVLSHDWQLLAFNRRFLEMWRVPVGIIDASDGRPLYEHALALVKDPQGFDDRMSELAATPLAESADVIELADGRIFEGESRPQMLNGEPVARVWSFRDATARLHAERALRQSEARARSLIENISDVITITNDEGDYVFVSPSVSRILGYSPEDLQGRRVTEFVHPDDATNLAEGLAHLTKTGEPVRTEFRYRHKDGSWRTLESLRIDARREPGVGGLLGVARDVTEKRRLEGEATMHRDAAWRRERLTALGTLVAGVAHEINNPLTYIMGSLELAELTLDEAPPHPDIDEVRRQIRTALDGSARIARIAKALKTVSKQEPIGERELVGLEGIIRNVAQLTQASLPDHIELVFEAPASTNVFGDASQLHQVVLNLAKNAIEACGDRRGLVSLTVRRTSAHAELIVTDNGPGIEPTVQARLFTPFFTTKSEGTGLGLSIVHSIVKSHGGDVLLESTPGRGSTFTVRLPLAV